MDVWFPLVPQTPASWQTAQPRTVFHTWLFGGLADILWFRKHLELEVMSSGGFWAPELCG